MTDVRLISWNVNGIRAVHKKGFLEVKHFPNLTIKGCETQHGDPTGVGFQMEHNDFRISYTADTSYFEKLPKYHKAFNGRSWRSCSKRYGWR